jgi:hypothetical protein
MNTEGNYTNYRRHHMNAKLLQEAIRRERKMKERAQRHNELTLIYAKEFRARNMTEAESVEFLEIWNQVTVTTQ